MQNVSGKNPFQQIQQVMAGPGSEAQRLEQSKQILTEALEGAGNEHIGPADLARIGADKMRSEGVPVSHALQIAGQAFGLEPSAIRQRIHNMGQLIAQHVAGSDVRDMSAQGTVTLQVGDVTDPTTQTDITVVPQKPWAGNRGGVAGAWTTYANGAGDVGQALLKAIDAYDNFANRSPGQKLPPGYTMAVPTGLDAASGPRQMLFATTIPSTEHAVQERTPETRDDRMANLQEKMQRVLIQLQQMALMDPDLAGQEKIRVTLPLIGTGPVGMVDTEECAAVMRGLIPKFQEQNPQFEFVFSMKNVGEQADFADQVQGFFDVFTGARQDVGPPRLRDARDLLNEVLAPHQQAATGQATLDDARVDQELSGEKDTWAQSFLAALDKVPDEAMSDRAQARTYFSGNDKETFSLIHKLLELPQHHTTFGADGAGLQSEVWNMNVTPDQVGRQPVTKDQIKELLSSPRIAAAAKEILGRELASVYGDAGALSKDAGVGEIISGAVGSFLLAALTKGHESIEQSIDRSLSDSSEAIADLTERLELSEEQVRSLTSDTSDLGAEIRALKRDIRGKDQEIDSLERQLQSNQSARETRRSYATSFPSASTGC